MTPTARFALPRWHAPRAPHDLIWLAALALVLLGVGLGLRDPWPADEPRFAMIARDMVETGRWFLPHRGPELYAEKPPVFLWFEAAAYALTGQLRIAFLLPSLLAAFGTLALVWDLARRLYSRQAAFWATAALLVTVQFTLQGRTAQIDALLVFWTTLGLYGLLRHLLLGPSWGWYLLAGAACGLGIITKGTGFLPWLMLIPYGWARARGWPGLWRQPGGWRWALGPLAMLVAIGCWLVPLWWLADTSGDPTIRAYRDELLFRQTVTRYANAWHHHQPAWYFVGKVIPLLWLPLSLLLPWAIPAWARRWRRHDARKSLLLGYTVLVIAFFSASPGKREMYILPALPALALAYAPLLPGLLARRGVQRALFGLAVLLAGVAAAMAAAALFGRPGFAVRVESENGVAPWNWLLGVGLIGLAATARLRPRRGALAFAAVMTALWCGYGLFGYPQMTDARSGRAIMQAVERALPPTAQLGLVDVPEQFLFQVGRPATSFGFKAPLEQQQQRALAWLQQAPDRWLLGEADRLGPCIDVDRTVLVGVSNRREVRLAPVAAVREACREAP